MKTLGMLSKKETDKRGCDKRIVSFYNRQTISLWQGPKSMVRIRSRFWYNPLDLQRMGPEFLFPEHSRNIQQQAVSFFRNPSLPVHQLCAPRSPSSVPSQANAHNKHLSLSASFVPLIHTDIHSCCQPVPHPLHLKSVTMETPWPTQLSVCSGLTHLVRVLGSGFSGISSHYKKGYLIALSVSLNESEK